MATPGEILRKFLTDRLRVRHFCQRSIDNLPLSNAWLPNLIEPVHCSLTGRNECVWQTGLPQKGSGEIWSKLATQLVSHRFTTRICKKTSNFAVFFTRFPRFGRISR